MAKIAGPLLSRDATGTIARAITYARSRSRTTVRSPIARGSAGLRFAQPATAPPATPAQQAHRDIIAAATAYAKAIPPADLPLIAALASARRLPTFQAAQAYYIATPPPAGNTHWDGGTTTWDLGATIWDL